MTFPNLIKAISAILLCVLFIASLIVGIVLHLDFWYIMLCLLCSFLIFLILYSIGFALDKLDCINHYSKIIARASLSYLNENPLVEDMEEDEKENEPVEA